MKLKLFVIGAAIAALLQSAALGKIIYDRADLLRNGTEVVLQSGMVDPRDLFRGHFVVLNLTISRIPAKDVKLDQSFIDALNEDQSRNPLRGQTVYVSLKKGEDEFWLADTLYTELPEKLSVPVIRGEYSGNFRVTAEELTEGQGTHSIRFPINRFFAEKNRARDLEKVRRDRNLGVVVALSETGEAAIKGISVEGELIYVESVW